jgi:hypothetical protein
MDHTKKAPIELIESGLSTKGRSRNDHHYYNSRYRTFCRIIDGQRYSDGVSEWSTKVSAYGKDGVMINFPFAGYGRRPTMKLWLAVTILTALVLSFDLTPAMTAERACRPSLSNFYHCPDTTTPSSTASSTRTTKKCVPSMSNFWTCPGSSKPGRTASTRPCRPSLSNGYHCPGTTSASPRIERETPRANRETPAREQRGSNTTASTERACRPSLSNGYKCPGSPSSSEKPSGAGEYATEAQARAHCPGDTVVWANTRSNIYHFAGTRNYGTTIAGAYMCERDSLSEGMRAAKNETHP